MKLGRWIVITALLAINASISAQTAAPDGVSGAPGLAQQKTGTGASDSQARGTGNKSADEAELLESSREAGLLTDWHLEGRFGHGGRSDFARKFAPEKLAQKKAGKLAGVGASGFEGRHYELVFPEGIFALPPDMAGQPGVFYADSSTYLTSSGDWNVYLESKAEAAVFVDGRRVLTRGGKAAGVLRAKIHVESGYHLVMVKFTAHAAPFRVAILPPNSGSRRKNNTPYLKASPGSEDMLAGLVICRKKVSSD